MRTYTFLGGGDLLLEFLLFSCYARWTFVNVVNVMMVWW